MAATSLSIRHTDESYSTHGDLSKALQTSLIGDFWKGIDEYRKQKAKKILLKTISGLPFYFVETPALLAKFDEFEHLLESFSALYKDMLDMPLSRETIDRKFGLPLLKKAASMNALRCSETTLKAIVSGYFDRFANNEAGAKMLSSYYGIMQSLNVEKQQFSIDALGTYYAFLKVDEELTSFYRVSDIEKSKASVYGNVIHVLKEAPSEQIDTLMNALDSFLRTDPCRWLYKAVAASYYISYIRPFDSYNELLSCLAFASIYNNFGAGFLPLTFALCPSSRWDELNREVQLSGDLTYILVHIINTLTPMIMEMKDAIAKQKNEGMKQEQYRLEQTPTPPPTLSPLQQEEEVELPESEDEYEEVELEEVKPIKEELPNPNQPSELALSLPKMTLSEKDIKDWAKYLLETHPRLRKPQAMFFASHCTIGRYYSIQDYKKYARCVYETARTSMDNLAREKLYKKLKIKNKYVYTPIKQGE